LGLLFFIELLHLRENNTEGSCRSALIALGASACILRGCGYVVPLMARLYPLPQRFPFFRVSHSGWLQKNAANRKCRSINTATRVDGSRVIASALKPSMKLLNATPKRELNIT
jgi:hypothetical protein